MAHGQFPYTQHGTRFLGCAPLQDQPLAVWGLPFDGAVSNRPGARFGPAAIRQASLMLCDGIHPLFDVSPLPWLGDAGDLPLPNASGLEAARAAIEAAAGPLAQRHHLVSLGGDHAITLALLRALARQHGPLALLHADAHCDTWTDHFGEPSGHGTWVAEALQEGLVSAEHTVQLGLRSSGVREAREFVTRRGGLVLGAHALRGLDGMALAPVLREVRQRLGARPCYLSLDIDCLDPAFAPGTGTPEAGGLSSSQLLTVVEGLSELDWVGMDCVEVAPPYDHAELTSLAAATLVWTHLCGQARRLAAARPPA